MTEPVELLTLPEAAERLRVSVRMMQRLVATGRIPVLEIGPRTRRVDALDLDEYRRRGRRRVA